MSEGAGETPAGVFYPQRAAGLRRRWEGEEATSISPLCAASLPLTVHSGSFDISEPASTPIMARMHTNTLNNNPTLSSLCEPTEDAQNTHKPEEGGPITKKPTMGAPQKASGGEGAPSRKITHSASLKRGAPLDIGSADFGAQRSSNSSSSSSSRGRSGVVDPILNPDGVTVRRPPLLGIRSGDPVAAHILKTKTFNLSKP